MGKILAAILMLGMVLTGIPALDTSALAATSYRIEVDITNQIVTIFDTSDKHIVRQMLCSTGAEGSTPLGTYTMPAKQAPDERTEWYYFNAYGVYAKYATRVYKGIMFHSIPYNSKRDSSICKKDVEDFGTPASHGCIRLRWEDAKFIAENCLKGTKVKFYESGERDEDLRELLMQSSYTGENGQTYSQFLGIPEEEGVLGRFSSGSAVYNLQYRLRDLGLFSESVNGEYRASTVNAVKQVQRALGLEETGIASLELQTLIYSSDAPVAMNVTLKEGMSGPAVRNLQQNLQALQLYSGDVDGVYDLEVIEAVKLFQSAYGFTVSGTAAPVVQKAVYYEKGKIEALFAMNSGYEMTVSQATVYLGRITASVGIRLREGPSTESAVLARLADGDIVFALKYGKTWSQVQFEGNVGYIKNSFAEYFQQDVSILTYCATDDDMVYAIGYTPEQYMEGAAIPAVVFEEYLASGGSLDDYEGIGRFATVQTDAQVLLNMRKTPSTTGEVVATLEGGTQVRVVVQSAEWSCVTCGDQMGYLMNEYLEFWQGPEDALDEDVAPEGGEGYAEDALYAQVTSENGEKAPVYDVDSGDATLLGHLKNGVQVEVITVIDDWCRIRYEGREGYMQVSDLRFTVEAQ